MDYLRDVGILVKSICKKNEIKPIAQYFYLDCNFVLSRSNADSHNYKKLLFDALEHGELVENDKYIMDRTQSIKVDPKNPRVELTVILPIDVNNLEK